MTFACKNCGERGRWHGDYNPDGSLILWCETPSCHLDGFKASGQT